MPHITLVYGGALGLLTLLLGMNVTRVRAGFKVWVDPNTPPKKLFVAIRAHGNLVEWAPLLVTLLLLVELGGGAKTQLWIAGGMLLGGRVLHGVGLAANIPVSPLGSALTWVVAAWLSVWAMMLGLS